MKNFAAKLAFVAACVLVVSAKEHPKREKIVAFYNCAICSGDEETMAEYLKCKELKPTLHSDIKEHCLKEVLGDHIHVDDFYDDLCKADDGVGKVFDCIHDMKEKKEIKLSDEDKEKFKEFKACAIELSEKHCHK